MSSQKPTIVVVGGGFAGIATVQSLRKRNKEYNIVLISNKFYFEYFPALYKLVTGALAIEVFVPLKMIFPKGVEIINGHYTHFENETKTIFYTNEANVEKSLNYDYLVLALGSETNFFNIPGLPELSYSFKSVKEALRLKEHFDTLFKESSVLPKDEMIKNLHTVIVGGGPSGTELAGDLATYLRTLAKKNKIDPSFVTIDLIESNPRILATLPPGASIAADKRLRKLGVHILTNRTLEAQEVEQVYIRGLQIQSNTVVWTAGTRISSSYHSIPNIAYTDKKRIAIDQYFGLPNTDNVFITGDGAGTLHSGLAQTAIHNGQFLGEHIHRAIVGKEFISYIPKKGSYIVPVGDYWAILSIGNFTITGFIPWVLRSLVDLMYFTSIVPLWYVLDVYRQGRKYRKTN